MTNTRLEEFATTVAHDLRNPLNVAKARLQLAEKGAEDDNHEAVGEALNRMDRIIDDMLWLAREGEDIGQTQPVELQEITERAWGMVAGKKKEAELQHADNSELPTVAADPDRLQQLLENLFRNAIEHAGPNVTVRVDPISDGFAVEDSGPGIPPDERHQVFDMEYSTTATGTGYGLQIVERIADAHNWDIRVTGSTDGGARFEIRSLESD